MIKATVNRTPASVETQTLMRLVLVAADRQISREDASPCLLLAPYVSDLTSPRSPATLWASQASPFQTF